MAPTHATREVTDAGEPCDGDASALASDACHDEVTDSDLADGYAVVSTDAATDIDPPATAVGGPPGDTISDADLDTALTPAPT